MPPSLINLKRVVSVHTHNQNQFKNTFVSDIVYMVIMPYHSHRVQVKWHMLSLERLGLPSGSALSSPDG